MSSSKSGLIVMKRALLYFGLAIIGLALMAIFIVITNDRELPPVGWLGLVAFTPVVFWQVSTRFRRYWNRRAFWVAFSAFLLLHIVVFSALLLLYPSWRLLWFMPISVLEIFALFMAFTKLFDRPRSHRPH